MRQDEASNTATGFGVSDASYRRACGLGLVEGSSARQDSRLNGSEISGNAKATSDRWSILAFFLKCSPFTQLVLYGMFWLFAGGALIALSAYVVLLCSEILSSERRFEVPAH